MGASERVVGQVLSRWNVVKRLRDRAVRLGSIGRDGDMALNAKIAARVLEDEYEAPHHSLLRAVGVVHRDGTFYELRRPSGGGGENKE